MHSLSTRCETCPVRNKSICAALSDEELAGLSKMSYRKRVKAHQLIFLDGDDADQYFNVVEGIVKLVKTSPDGEQHIIGLIYPSDFIAQPLSAQHTYSAEAATDVELCCFPRAMFEAEMKINPTLQQRLFESTVRELDICRNWTLLLGRKSSSERVATFLYNLAKRVPLMGCGHAEHTPIRFRLPFTRGEIADYLGLTLETVSRQLSRLKQEKVIELPTTREVVVPDLGRLAAMGSLDRPHAAERGGPGRGEAVLRARV